MEFLSNRLVSDAWLKYFRETRRRYTNEQHGRYTRPMVKNFVNKFSYVGTAIMLNFDDHDLVNQLLRWRE